MNLKADYESTIKSLTILLKEKMEEIKDLKNVSESKVHDFDRKSQILENTDLSQELSQSQIGKREKIQESLISDERSNQSENFSPLEQISKSQMICSKLISKDKICSNPIKLNKSIQFNQINPNKQPELEYDAIFKFKSVLETLYEGCELSYSNFQKIYQKQSDSIVISTLGNLNKGKTFLLESLSNFHLSSGFNNPTLGISLKSFSTSENLTSIIALDTLGLSSPINLSKFKSKSDFEEFREAMNDKIATEDFIQNFVCKISTLLFVLLSDLNLDDQKLVNKLKSFDCIREPKSIFIVHNLMNCSSIDECRRNINEKITKSFILERKYYSFDSEGMNSEYYVEELENGSNFIHVILAQQNSEAGEYYNQTTLIFLRKFIDSSFPKKFNFVKEISEFMKTQMNLYLSSDKSEVNVIVDEKEGIPCKIRIECHDSVLRLKNLSIDDFGLLKVNNELQPVYTLLHTEDENKKYLKVIIECPGKLPKLKLMKEISEKRFRLKISGEKQVDEWNTDEQIAFKSIQKCPRPEGKFVIYSQYFDRDEFDIDEKKCKFSYKDGLLIGLFEKIKYNPDFEISFD